MEIQTLLAKSYCPYSKFPVAAKVYTSTGEEFVGVNVENASYALTMCAEASAIANMVSSSSENKQVISSVDIICLKNPGNRIITPCGACRQMISEFASEDCVVNTYCIESKEKNTFTFQELLPFSFTLK